MPGNASTPAAIEAKRSRCGEITLRIPTRARFIEKISCSSGFAGVAEDPLLERVDPVVDRGEAREEAVDEPVDDPVQEPGRIVDRRVPLDVALAQRRERRRVVAMERDQVAVGVEAVHLDEPVRVVVARRAEHDEEHVAVVVVDLRPLAEAPRVLERERVKAELFPQDLEICCLGSVDVEPEEASFGEQLTQPVALEGKPVPGVAVDEVGGALRRGVGGHRSIVRRRSEAGATGEEPRRQAEACRRRAGRLRAWTSTPS